MNISFSATRLQDQSSSSFTSDNYNQSAFIQFLEPLADLQKPVRLKLYAGWVFHIFQFTCTPFHTQLFYTCMYTLLTLFLKASPCLQSFLHHNHSKLCMNMTRLDLYYHRMCNRWKCNIVVCTCSCLQSEENYLELLVSKNLVDDR